MLACQRCDKSFERKIADIKRGRTIFCSRECSDKFKKESAEVYAKNVLISGKKQCKACSVTKPLSEFPKSKSSIIGYFSYCTPCRREINRAQDIKRRSEKRDILIRQRRNANYKRSFGITINEYESMLNKQNGVCAICNKDKDRVHFHVDHDHVSGKIRGILCENCNRGIGMFKDDVELLNNAITYLCTQGDINNGRP